MASLFREAVARAHDFLLEPVSAVRLRPGRSGRTEVAVLGLSDGCGASTVARGLALTLKVPGGRAVQVLRAGEDPVEDDEVIASADGPAALVWDIASGGGAAARLIAQRTNAVVLVAAAGSPPPLAELVARALEKELGPVILVANRVTDPSPWSCADLCLPESRLGAALTRRGHRPPGALGSALARLTELIGNR
jgi:hypothetical protein